MKLFKNIILVILLLPITLITFSIIYLSIVYTPTYVYRLITQNVADVYDYQYYDYRTIRANDNPYNFIERVNEDLIEGIFKKIVNKYGFNSINEWAEKSQTTALIFIRKDTILYEKYFNGFNRQSLFHSQSMAKSFISFLIGVAIDDKLINSINDPITKYIPELEKRDLRFNKISIKHLLEMTSGIKYNTSFIPGTFIHAPWHDEAVGYYHPNIRNLLLNEVDIAEEPGKKFQYCNYNTSYLGLIIERVTKKTVSQYLEEKLWTKIMEYNAQFSIDSKESGFEYMPSRLIARAIDYARFGRLYLNKGVWNNEQIISKDWIEKSISPIRNNKILYPNWFGEECPKVYYGFQWWGHLNCDSTYQFFASGNLGQNIYLIPEKEIIIVHCGNSLEYYSDFDLWTVSNILSE